MNILKYLNNKIIEFLLMLNNRIYSMYYHVPILFLWSFLFAFGYGTYWFLTGLFIYFFLVFLRLVKEGSSNTFEIYNELGFLPFLVGLNIIMIFGPLTIPLVIMLILFDKEQN